MATTLQGTESPGGCCAATPTKKNEVFDLQVKKKNAKSSENSKQAHECSAARRTPRFYNSKGVCLLIDLRNKKNIKDKNMHIFLKVVVSLLQSRRVSKLPCQHIIALYSLMFTRRFKRAQPFPPQIRLASYLYAKCVPRQNVIPSWVIFYANAYSQREILFMVRVDEGSTNPQEFRSGIHFRNSAYTWCRM